MNNSGERYFVKQDSIVRRIWGSADCIMFIFGASAAEFALNKAVDWLYFTGRLPADPLARLFSTVAYARMILFLPYDQAVAAIEKINHIHAGVEQARGARIPDWAYRDVLFMLIDYSVRSYELLNRPLTGAEKEEIFDVFYRVGAGMHLRELPSDYNEWEQARAKHIEADLGCSEFTHDLFRQYRKHLGAVRFLLLKQVQLFMAPKGVRELLPVKDKSWIRPLISLYKLSRHLRVDNALKEAILPAEYKSQIKALDQKAMYA